MTGRNSWWITWVIVAWVVGVASASRAAEPQGAAPAADAGSVAEPSKPAEPTPAPASVPAPPPSPAPRAPEKTAWSGFLLQSADGSFKARFGGYVQADGRFYASDAAKSVTDSLLVRRAYLILQGDAGRYFSFYVSPDFGDGKAGLEDGYADMRLGGRVRLRLGKMKSPMGLEHLQGTTALHFIERGLPTQLSPNRDVGVMLHGELAQGVVAYAAGLFNGTVDGASLDRDTNDSKEGVGRLFVRPFRTRKQAVDLGLGIAGSYGRHEGALPAYKTDGQLGFFSYVTGASATKAHYRIAPQGFAYYRRVGILAEWTQSTQEARKDKTSEPVSLANTAWGVTGSLVLSGEKSGYSGVKPRRGFDPAAHAYGAVELVARVGELRIDAAAFSNGLADALKSARRAKVVGVGLNWYLSESFKYVVNFERTTFNGGAAQGDRPNENAIFVRAQASF